MRALLSGDLAPVLTGGLDRHQLSGGCQICSPPTPPPPPARSLTPLKCLPTPGPWS